MKKNEINDLVNFINDDNISINCKNNSTQINNSTQVKKKKKNYNKKLKNNKARKNSEEVAIDKFIKNITSNSVPVDKIVKIKTDINNNWVNEVLKES